MADDLIELFKDRDRAVIQKDRDLLYSTQLGEVPEAASVGYMQLNALRSSILTVANRTSLDRIAIVREEYQHLDGSSSGAVVVYLLAVTPDGLRIYRAIPC